jgi:hypothetical protein
MFIYFIGGTNVGTNVVKFEVESLSFKVKMWEPSVCNNVSN